MTKPSIPPLPPVGRPLSAMEHAAISRQRTVEKLDRQRRDHVAQMKADFASLLTPDRELTKDLFVANFLPYFCGEVPATKEVVIAWLHVASSPFHAVNLVENGQVFGVVPPLQDLSAFSPISGDQRRAYNAGSIMEMSAKRAGIDPVSAVSTMSDGLAARFLTKQFEVSESHRQAWVALLALFGKTLQPGQAPDKAAEAEAAEEDLGDYE